MYIDNVLTLLASFLETPSVASPVKILTVRMVDWWNLGQGHSYAYSLVVGIQDLKCSKNLRHDSSVKIIRFQMVLPLNLVQHQLFTSLKLIWSKSKVILIILLIHNSEFLNAHIVSSCLIIQLIVFQEFLMDYVYLPWTVRSFSQVIIIYRQNSTILMKNWGTKRSMALVVGRWGFKSNAKLNNTATSMTRRQQQVSGSSTVIGYSYTGQTWRGQRTQLPLIANLGTHKYTLFYFEVLWWTVIACGNNTYWKALRLSLSVILPQNDEKLENKTFSVQLQTMPTIHWILKT